MASAIGIQRPPFISIDVKPLSFEIAATGGVQILKLTNSCPTRLAFKIKSTNNDHYKMSKIFGFIEVGKTIDLGITRTVGPAKQDRVVIHYTAVEKTSTDPSLPFKENDGLRLVNMVNVFINAVPKVSDAQKAIVPEGSKMVTAIPEAPKSAQIDPNKPVTSPSGPGGKPFSPSDTYQPTVLPKGPVAP